ncbi:MAG TPA: hypothetical protein VKZ89_11245 [Thermobifida alba]|nr:hypothetical protein [Thermobifida alba]
MARTRLIAAAAGAVLVGAVTAGAVGLRADEKQTPCEAAISIVNEVRDKDPAVVGAAERDGTGYGSMFRGLITGDYEDVEGPASPEVAERLRRVADDLADAETAGPDEFTAGQTGQDMDALVAACGN